MPRTRKPQASQPSIQWRWRVANTTTSSLPQVYRFWTWKVHTQCKWPTSSVTVEAPLHVQIVGDNVYHVTLNTQELANKLWQLENIDLSNVEVTLWTVNWPITLNWNLDIESGTLAVDEASIDTLNSLTWTISTLTSTDFTATNVDANDVSTVTFATSSNATIGWTLWVTWATTLDSTLDVTWATTLWNNLSVAWNETVAGNSTITWNLTANSIIAPNGNIQSITSTSISTWSLDASTSITTDWTLIVEWNSTLANVTANNASIGWDLSVTWASIFTWDVSTNNIYSSGNASLNDVTVAWNETIAWTLTTNWATLLNNSLTVVGTATMGGNASIAWNLNVAWNSSTTWTLSAWGDTTLWGKLTVTDVSTFNNDVNINDDLTVTGTSHLAWVETTGSVDITWTLRTSWAINAGNWVYVTWQVESDSVVTTNTVTDNLTVNWNIALWNSATAPDFVLQSEKGAANGVAPLDANGQIDAQYLPPVYTTAIVKMGTWTFSNSNTSVVVYADITADSAVLISNYQDIIWDLDETISIGQITVVSNQTETWSYKYLIVNPISNS